MRSVISLASQKMLKGLGNVRFYVMEKMNNRKKSFVVVVLIQITKILYFLVWPPTEITKIRMNYVRNCYKHVFDIA